MAPYGTWFTRRLRSQLLLLGHGIGTVPKEKDRFCYSLTKASQAGRPRFALTRITELALMYLFFTK